MEKIKTYKNFKSHTTLPQAPKEAINDLVKDDLTKEEKEENLIKESIEITNEKRVLDFDSFFKN
ncbi:hypothetical protein ACI6Q2_13565 [Chitinophagaceae bacterium LWZ2-11]